MLIDLTFLVLPFWCLLTLVVRTKSKRAINRYVCVKGLDIRVGRGLKLPLALLFT